MKSSYPRESDYLVKCEWVKEHFLKYRAGTLMPYALHIMQEHLARCERCWNRLVITEVLTATPLYRPPVIAEGSNIYGYFVHAEDQDFSWGVSYSDHPTYAVLLTVQPKQNKGNPGRTSISVSVPSAFRDDVREQLSCAKWVWVPNGPEVITVSAEPKKNGYITVKMGELPHSDYIHTLGSWETILLLEDTFRDVRLVITREEC